MEAAQKLKRRATVPASDPTDGYIPKKPIAESQRQLCTPELIVASFTVARKEVDATHAALHR